VVELLGTVEPNYESLRLQLRKRATQQAHLVNRARSLSQSDGSESEEAFLAGMSLKLHSLQRMLGAMNLEDLQTTVERQRKQLL
jgi:hypothetical protein